MEAGRGDKPLRGKFWFRGSDVPTTTLWSETSPRKRQNLRTQGSDRDDGGKGATSGPLSDQGLNTEDETTPSERTWYITY